ncbi:MULTISPECIES: DsrE family protein [Pediococcus]|uniref:DsrE family protein n=1 Tax=Pediococcus TaxID=1253 RepID=UPI000E8E8535|nr:MULTISPECIES: DsrE family protein [Pediococcus]MCT3028941.1 sulfur reduction protein DsrE [Pediococcus parvulus]MCT3034973.1 sulfur reduction protein DsrE [Pediococcus parvulus]HBO47775.1 sulfur reduction protein DsrE [Pediococcus sp.]
MKIVFHIDENSKWQTALSNVANALSYAKQKQLTISIVVVVNGSAITEYLANDVQVFISTHQGTVEFHACQNAMASHHISAEQLPKTVKVVPAGVIDLVTLQDQGFRYIKP